MTSRATICGRRHVREAAVAAAFGAALFAGCGGEDEPSVEYPRLALVQELVLRNPSEAGARSQLGGAAIDDRGFIYLTEWALSTVLVHDSAGKFVRRIGSPGRGEGELLLPGSLGIIGDTVWVSDPPMHRISLFTREGKFIGAITDSVPETVDSTPRRTLAGLLADGSLLYSMSPGLVGAGVQPDRDVPFMRVKRDGSVDTLFRVPIPGTFAIPNSTRPMYQPFDERPIIAVRRDGLAWIEVERSAGESGPASATVTMYSAEKGREWSSNVALDAVRLPRGTADSIIEAATFDTTTQRELRAWLRIPRRMPLVSAAALADDGSVWLQETAQSDSARWIRLDSTGTPNGAAELPREAQLLFVTANKLWVLLNDDSGNSTVIRYAVMQGQQ